MPGRDAGKQRHALGGSPQATAAREDAKELALGNQMFEHGEPRPRGVWTAITPSGLSKAKTDDQWDFALYREFASERSDQQDYIALLFRDESRTQFGIREWLGKARPVWREYGRVAKRVVEDARYRVTLLSSDSDLPKMWKRR